MALYSRSIVRAAFTAIACIAFSPPAAAVDSTCVVVGHVLDGQLRPLVGASVRIVGTLMGAMTNSDGFYVVRDIEPGTWLLQAQISGMAARESLLTVVPGETAEIDWCLSAEPYVTMENRQRYVWPQLSSRFWIEADLSLSLPEGRSAEGLQIWTEQGTGWPERFWVFPSIRERDCKVQMPAGTASFHWSFPWAAARCESIPSLGPELHCSIRLTPAPDVYSPGDLLTYLTASGGRMAAWDFTDNEWVADGVSLSRQVVDISQFGDSALSGAGFVGSRFFFDGSVAGSPWRAVLVFHKRVLVLREGCDPIQYATHFPIRCFEASPDGRYLIAFDAVGALYRGGDAEWLDLSTGESRIFDPTPERTEMDPAEGGEEYYGPYDNLLLSNDGSILSISYDGAGDPCRSFVRTYTDALELQDTIHYGETETFRIDQQWLFDSQRSADGERTIVLGDSLGSRCLLVLGRDGEMLRQIPCLHQWDRGFSSDIDCRYVAFTSAGGLPVFDCTTGTLMAEWDRSGRSYGTLISPAGKVVGCAITDTSQSWQPETADLRARSIPEGRLLLSIPALLGRWSGARIISISDSGAILASVRGPEEAFHIRMVLFGSDGNPIWAGPLREDLQTAWWDQAGPILSSDETRLVYQDLMLINIITFSSDSTNQR